MQETLNMERVVCREISNYDIQRILLEPLCTLEQTAESEVINPVVVKLVHTFRPTRYKCYV